MITQKNIPPLRFRRFWCWLLTGHRWDKTDSNRMASRSMNRCLYCNTYLAGPD